MLGTSLTVARYKHLLAQPTLDVLSAPEEMSRVYNREPFLVRHRLSEHQLLQLPQLFALCRRMSSQVTFRFGTVPKDADFDTAAHKYRGDLTLEDAIEHLEEKQAYIMVYNPERDPEYRPLVESVLSEIAQKTAALDPVITWYSTYFFISAQNSVTPYHMDREMNFLLQIHGLKTVRLWDPHDPDVMTDAQKDKLLAFTGEARPTYHDALEAKAKVFQLEPGLGVHQPFIAPHLISTGSQVSVSWAVTYRTRTSDAWTAAHRFNHALRGLGLKPRPVGDAPALDRAKSGLLLSARRARALFAGREHAT